MSRLVAVTALALIFFEKNGIPFPLTWQVDCFWVDGKILYQPPIPAADQGADNLGFGNDSDFEDHTDSEFSEPDSENEKDLQLPQQVLAPPQTRLPFQFIDTMTPAQKAEYRRAGLIKDTIARAQLHRKGATTLPQHTPQSSDPTNVKTEPGDQDQRIVLPDVPPTKILQAYWPSFYSESIFFWARMATYDRH